MVFLSGPHILGPNTGFTGSGMFMSEFHHSLIDSHLL